MGAVCNACDAAIVPGGGNSTGTMGSVTVFFPCADFIAVWNKIPAIYIIYIAVSVIVNAVSGNLIFIDPDGIF